MGQAIADLPDSIQKPAEPIPNADELLSQFAGEEIDRLLAEADAHPVDPIAPDASEALEIPTGADAATDDAALADQIESALQQLPSAVSGEELDQEIVAAAASAAPAADPFEAQVDELFNELKDRPEEKPPTPAAADVPPHDPITAQVVNVSALPAAIEQATSAAERAALDQPADIAALPERTVDVRPSMLVRILEIANAPVNSLPASLRDALGKVAILTLMNAVGVLLYLALFRK